MGAIRVLNRVLPGDSSDTVTQTPDGVSIGRATDLFASKTGVDGDFTINGNLTVNGATTTVNDIAVDNLYPKNVFSALPDLPDAGAYHGMVAHVHATGQLYFAHANAWHELISASGGQTINGDLSVNGEFLGDQIKSLSDRLTLLEPPVSPPTSFTINPVQWTNLTEINLSGEKLTNISFDNLVARDRTVETITEFTVDHINREIRGIQDQTNRNITAGVITTLTQIFPPNQAKHSGGDGNTNVLLTQQGSFWEMLDPIAYDAVGWSVANGTLDQDKLSQGIIKGFNASVGVQQMFSTPLVIGTKIVVKVERSDTNSGSVAFKHVKIDGNPKGGDIHIPRDDGFVEYTVTDTDMHGIRFSTMFGAREISSVSVFQGAVGGGTVQANGNGGLQKIAGLDGFNAGASSTNFIEGNSDGYVQFQWGAEFKSQRIGLTYQDVDFENILPFMLIINGNGRVFTNGSNAFGQDDFAEVGDYFRIRHFASDNTVQFQKRQDILDSEGNSLGQDYVTFHTHSSLSNGNNLFVDTSLYHIGSQLNDVLLAN